MTTRAAVVVAVSFAIFGSFYLLFPHRLTMANSTDTSTSGVPGLGFRLSQISKSPPSLLVTLRNSHPSSTFTVLKWGTPLDTQATNLGVFSFVDMDTGEEIDFPIIKISRKTPPSREEFIEIDPDTEHAIEVVFDKPWMPEKRPAKYKVKADGTFYAVWDKRFGEIAQDELEAYHDSPFASASLSSEQVVMVVE